MKITGVKTLLPISAADSRAFPQSLYELGVIITAASKCGLYLLVRLRMLDGILSFSYTKKLQTIITSSYTKYIDGDTDNTPRRVM